MTPMAYACAGCCTRMRMGAMSVGGCLLMATGISCLFRLIETYPDRTIRTQHILTLPMSALLESKCDFDHVYHVPDEIVIRPGANE
jgi:hypothetical protein